MVQIMTRKPTYAQLEKRIRALESRSADGDVAASVEKAQLMLEKDRKFDNQTKELKKTNIALDVLMGQHDRQIKTIKDTIHRNFNELILPDLYELKNKLKLESSRKMIDLIIANFEHLMSADADRLTSERYNLTKTELKVAAMIRNGMTSRQIREHLNVSADTVAFHRKNLRKKLGISRSGTELSQFLQHHL
jgi:DNA-binding CsgD family transcriptional regulator